MPIPDEWRDPLDDPVYHPFLHKRVRVRLDDAGQHWVEGRLMRLSVSGDVDVLENNGRMAYCWPALEIQPLPRNRNEE